MSQEDSTVGGSGFGACLRCVVYFCCVGGDVVSERVKAIQLLIDPNLVWDTDFELVRLELIALLADPTPTQTERIVDAIAAKLVADA